MLNLHQNLICPSEEPFAVFFYDRYKDKTSWTEYEILRFIDEFWLMAEKNLDLFFTSKQKLFDALWPQRENLNYRSLCNIIYLQFFEPKEKKDVNVIVDKQIKYFFYLKRLIRIFPDSKFIILVRDPRVNAIRKKNRNLNSGQHPLYLVSLWKNTYRNIDYLISNKKPVLIIKYEDFVSAPETALKEICNFLKVDYTTDLLETEGVYEKFLNIQRDKVNDEHLAYLKDFHSGLYQKVNTEKIRLKGNEIDVELNDKIVKLTRSLLVRFNYNSDLLSHKQVKFNLMDRFQMVKANLYRPQLLMFYLKIPLSVKLIIKKLRN